MREELHGLLLPLERYLVHVRVLFLSFLETLVWIVQGLSQEVLLEEPHRHVRENNRLKYQKHYTLWNPP